MGDDLITKIYSGLSEKLSVSLITNLVVRKLGKKGLCVSTSDKVRLKKWVTDGARGSFSVSDVQHQDSKLEIHFTARDQRRMMASFSQQISDCASSVIASATVSTARPLLRKLRRSLAKAVHQSNDALHSFERRLNRTWRTPFALLDLQLHLAREIGAELNEELRKDLKAKKAPLVEVMTRLHARSCRLASEVIVLLRAGYAEGALTRWRSLHEVAVVLHFIREHGVKTARRYLDHDTIESWKAVREHNIHGTKLGATPIPQAEIILIKQRFDAAVKKHGPEFANSYGWASTDLNIKNPSFADIERFARLAHFRPYYRLASHSVHANPKGILFQMGLMEGNQLLLVGPSNYGLADAGQNTGLSLSQTTAALATLAPTYDRLLLIQVMTELAGDIGKSFVGVQHKIEGREAKSQSGNVSV